MPPPPPPSKSYLLVLDSDSSDDSSDDDYRLRQEYYRLAAAQEKTPTQSESETRTIHTIPIEDHPPETKDRSTTKKLTKNQKKRRQRRKKKKANKVQQTQKGVSFSSVSIRAFPRAFSADTVPGHGGWPLGMSLDGYKDNESISVEEFEETKQRILRERWEGILASREKVQDSPKHSSPSKKKKSPPKIVDEEVLQLVHGDRNDRNQTAGLERIVFETRQWDYRSKVKNPLFGSVSEDERHAIFLQASDPETSVEHSDNSTNHRRPRSNSMGNHRTNQKGNRRSLSNSVGNHDVGNGVQGVFNDEYNQAMVHHVRNELEQIRFERNKSGATGCNCRKLVVYLPPKDGSGGKKSQHRRLKPSKVVSELKKRHLYDEAVARLSREEMEKLLHDVVEKESCCHNDDCFCIRNDIVCQADACSCWHDSHVHTKHKSESFSNADIRKRCGNPLGMYLVDADAIDEYRKKIIRNAPWEESRMTGSENIFCLPTQETS